MAYFSLRSYKLFTAIKTIFTAVIFSILWKHFWLLWKVFSLQWNVFSLQWKIFDCSENLTAVKTASLTLYVTHMWLPGVTYSWLIRWASLRTLNRWNWDISNSWIYQSIFTLPTICNGVFICYQNFLINNCLYWRK